ncbi:MAG TPA: hypothetical protein VGF40_17605, partial [Thermoanaerobaculia bacterium]
LPGDRWLLGYQNLYARRFDVATPAPVVPERVLAFFRAATRGDRDDLVDLTGIRWVLTSRERLPRGYDAAGRAVEGVRLFENRGPIPPLQFWSGAGTAGGEDPLARLLAPAYDVRRRIEVDPAPRNAGGGERVDVPFRLRIDGSAAEAELVAPSAGFVVLTQLATDGWRVAVDGAPARALVVGGLFRGVEVAAGRHVVRWTYRPLSLYVGAIVTALTIVALALAALRTRRRPVAM